MVYSNRSSYSARLFILLGVVVILLVPGTSAHALIAGVSLDGNVSASVVEANEREALKREESTKRQTAIALQMKAIDIMVTLGYSRNDAKAFVKLLMIAGVIK